MSTDVLTNQNPTPNTKESNASCNLIMCNMSISFPNPPAKCRQAEKVVKDVQSALDAGKITNYQSPKVTFNEYWDEECILHPTNSHCKIFDN